MSDLRRTYSVILSAILNVSPRYTLISECIGGGYQPLGIVPQPVSEFDRSVSSLWPTLA